MEILKIYLEEQFLTKYYMIKHLILLKFQNMMDFNVDLLQWFIIFFDKNSSATPVNKSAGTFTHIETEINFVKTNN